MVAMEQWAKEDVPNIQRVQRWLGVTYLLEIATADGRGVNSLLLTKPHANYMPTPEYNMVTKHPTGKQGQMTRGVGVVSFVAVLQ